MTTYESLGLRPLINADGMKTRWGGSLMPPEVVQAMSRAAGNFVDLPELHRAAGRRIAELIGSSAVEDVAIVSGAAAVTICGGEQPGDGRFALKASLAEICHVAHAQGVPVIVDAAAELPPPENLRKFSERGADLVVFSGGKGLRGPQASGLILGKRALIEACRLNQNPNSSVGRPMKVGKEEICGLLKAVELYVARDHAADLRRWEAWTQIV